VQHQRLASQQTLPCGRQFGQAADDSALVAAAQQETAPVAAARLHPGMDGEREVAEPVLGHEIAAPPPGDGQQGLRLCQARQRRALLSTGQTQSVGAVADVAEARIAADAGAGVIDEALSVRKQQLARVVAVAVTIGAVPAAVSGNGSRRLDALFLRVQAGLEREGRNPRLRRVVDRVGRFRSGRPDADTEHEQGHADQRALHAPPAFCVHSPAPLAEYPWRGHGARGYAPARRAQDLPNGRFRRDSSPPLSRSALTGARSEARGSHSIRPIA